LSHNQASVEDKLLRDAYPGDPPALYLYDVT
jgi:hypothetical protein